MLDEEIEIRNRISIVLTDAGIKFSLNEEGNIVFAEKDHDKVVSVLDGILSDNKVK